ncbi:10220_t:CDS:1, partial [Racocetra fulgida]
KIGLIVSFLDLQIKNLKFLNDKTIKATIINKVQALCTEEEDYQPIVEPNESFMSISEPKTTNSLILALYNSKELDD